MPRNLRCCAVNWLVLPVGAKLGPMKANITNRVGALLTLSAAFACTTSIAKPIAFAGGTTLMVEYGAGTMAEVQGFYAPSHRYSFGGGYLRLDSDVDESVANITYVRGNYLVKRWNMAAAQANVFVWGGAGGASGNDFSGNVFTGNAGAQADYETRRIYGSLLPALRFRGWLSV